MTPFVQNLLASLALVLAGAVLLWLVSLARRDASIVDPVWGSGFIAVVWLVGGLHPPPDTRGWLLLGLITVWGARLSLFLGWRNWGHAEDYRYAAMRQYHGDRFWWVSLFTVFLLQGAILWFVSWPVQAVLALPTGTALGILDLTGVLLWLTGLFFESVGDWQLARFKSDPANKGRVLDRGLWRYTRHPNYFGDFCVWWGVYLIAVQGGAWWTIASPSLMAFLLLRVSGVAMLEQTIGDRRPAYAAYQRQTNAFFPGPPRAER